MRTGAPIGCAWVSTGQLFDRQQRVQAETSCIRVFADKLSGKTSRDGPRAASGARTAVPMAVNSSPPRENDPWDSRTTTTPCPPSAGAPTGPKENPGN